MMLGICDGGGRLDCRYSRGSGVAHVISCDYLLFLLMADAIEWRQFGLDLFTIEHLWLLCKQGLEIESFGWELTFAGWTYF